MARAVFGAPRLVVLDEPNSSLDSDGEAALKQAILRLKDQEAAVVAIGHRPSLLASIDDVAFLRDPGIGVGPRDRRFGTSPLLDRRRPEGDASAGPCSSDPSGAHTKD